MKTIEQIVMKVARELYPSVIEVVKKSLEIWLAQQTPVAFVDDWHDGIFGRMIDDHIKSGTNLYLAPPTAPEQPPCDNNHVANGCEQFTGTVEQELADTNRQLAKAYARIATLSAKLADVTAIPEVRTPKFDCFSDSDGDYWYESPDDFNLLDSVGASKVGDEYEVLAGWNSVEAKYRVTKVPDETSDDYEVECISHPDENVPIKTAIPEGWQPISTAPKEGTRVLITGWGNTGVAGFENDAWCFMNDCWVGERVPTHWQPLPPPPPGEKK